MPSPDCSAAKQSLPVLRLKHDAAGDADDVSPVSASGLEVAVPRAHARGSCR